MKNTLAEATLILCQGASHACVALIEKRRAFLRNDDGPTAVEASKTFTDVATAIGGS